MSPLLGACLLSAAGSLPLQLLPLLVATLSAEQRAPTAMVGWIGSAFMIGQLVAALGLASMRVASLHRRHAVAAVSVFVIFLVLSAYSQFVILLFCWMLIGASCGTLFYLGTTTAARQERKTFAFSLRLSLTLFVSGLTIGCLHLIDALGSYEWLATRLSLLFCVIAALGLVLYKASTPLPAQTQPFSSAPRTNPSDWSGLWIVFLLFAGQIGFWAYAVQSSGERGMSLQQAGWALVVCKLVAAIVLLPQSRPEHMSEDKPRLGGPGLVLALGILLISQAHEVSLFVIGLMSWEVGLNVLSARVQARTVEMNPGTGLWLTAAVMLGAAAGPPLQGVAIAAGSGVLFIAFAVVSALAPWMWLRSSETASAHPATQLRRAAAQADRHSRPG